MLHFSQRGHLGAPPNLGGIMIVLFELENKGKRSSGIGAPRFSNKEGANDYFFYLQ